MIRHNNPAINTSELDIVVNAKTTLATVVEILDEENEPQDKVLLINEGDDVEYDRVYIFVLVSCLYLQYLYLYSFKIIQHYSC